MASSMPTLLLEEEQPASLDAGYADMERCGFCREELSSLHDVRKLGCGHEFCFSCLAEFKHTHGYTRCVSCSAEFGSVDLYVLERRAYTVPIHYILDTTVAQPCAEKHSESNLICGATDCSIGADCYCTECLTLFCVVHKQTHDMILSSHKTVSAIEYSKGKELLLPDLCKVHPGKTITIACNQCYKMMCERCMDEGAELKCNKGGEHVLKSLRYVADQGRIKLGVKMKSTKTMSKKFVSAVAELNSTADKLASQHHSRMEMIDSMVMRMKAFIDEGYAPMKSLVTNASQHNDSLVKKGEAMDKQFELLCKAIQGQREKLGDLSDKQVGSEIGKIESQLKQLTSLSAKISKLKGSLINASSGNLFVGEQPIEQLEPVSYPRDISLRDTLTEHDNTIMMLVRHSDDVVNYCKAECVELVSPAAVVKSNNLLIMDACYMGEFVFTLCMTPSKQITIQYSSPAVNCASKKAFSIKPSSNNWKQARLAVTDNYVVVSIDSETQVRLHPRGSFKQLLTADVGINKIMDMVTLKNDLLLICGKNGGETGAVTLVNLGKTITTKWIQKNFPSPTAMAVNKEQKYVVAISDVRKPFINIISFQGCLLQKICIPGANGPSGKYVSAVINATHELMLLEKGVGIHLFNTTKLMLALST